MGALGEGRRLERGWGAGEQSGLTVQTRKNPADSGRERDAIGKVFIKGSIKSTAGHVIECALQGRTSLIIKGGRKALQVMCVGCAGCSSAVAIR